MTSEPECIIPDIDSMFSQEKIYFGISCNLLLSKTMPISIWFTRLAETII